MSAVDAPARFKHSFLDVKNPDFRFDPFEQPAVSMTRNALMRCFKHVHPLRQSVPTLIGCYSVKWGSTQVRFMRSGQGDRVNEQMVKFE
jgi:hypothetical protein